MFHRLSLSWFDLKILKAFFLSKSTLEITGILEGMKITGLAHQRDIIRRQVGI